MGPSLSLHRSCISPIAGQTFFESIFLNLKSFLQLPILSLLNSWPLIFALEREHAGLPPHRQALRGKCVPFLILTALVPIQTTTHYTVFHLHYIPIHGL